MSQQQTSQPFPHENNTQHPLAEEISEEDLSTITGGMIPGAAGLGDRIVDAALAGRRLTRTRSAPARLERAPFTRLPESPTSSHSRASDFEDGQGTSPIHLLPQGH